MKLSERLALPPSLLAPALPAFNRLRSAAEKILSRWPDIAPRPDEKDRERLVGLLVRRLGDDAWEGATLSFVVSAGWATFDEVRRERSNLTDVRAFYCREIGASTRRSFLAAMLEIYQQTYAPGARHTCELAAALSDARRNFSERGARLLTGFPQCLDPRNAHEALAERMMAMPDVWNGLKAIGLRSPHAPGLTQHAHLAFVRRLAPELTVRAPLERLFRWLKPEGREPLKSGAREAIAAVLGHWTQSDPPEMDRRFITENLIGLYGDPRVGKGAPWSEVSDRELAVLLRWLTGENIRFFLDVVSAVEESHMWEPRRKFWLGLYEQKRIDAAWVAFSGAAVSYAQRKMMGGSDRALLKFGRQTAGGARADTSLLIMKIKNTNKIVVEGSHNYKVHIFQESNRLAPKLYQPAYDCEAIRMAIGAESRAHQSGWQGWLLERI